MHSKVSGKVLFDILSKLFDKDPLINELGLVESVDHFNCTKEGKQLNNNNNDNDNGSGVYAGAFVLGDHKLGVAFWCIPKLFKYCISEFTTNIYNSNISSSLDTNMVKYYNNITRCLLLINADHYTAWNVRKKLLSSSLLSHNNEIHLLNLIFSKHPKSGESWSHRRWVLTYLWKDISHDTIYNNDDYQNDLIICFRTAEIYPKNYYAWTHRQWLISLVTSKKELINELDVMKTWTDKHVSDHCGFHHRQAVLQMILKKEEEEEGKEGLIEGLVNNEMTYINNLMDDFPAHEAMWMHRRFIFVQLLDILVMQCKKRNILNIVEAIVDIIKIELVQADKHIEDDGVVRYEHNRRFAVAYKLWVYYQGERWIANVDNNKINYYGDEKKVLVDILDKIWPNKGSRVWKELV